MQLGMIGLGRMGGNMVERIQRNSSHQTVAYDPNKEAVAKAEAVGAIGVHSLEELVANLTAPRAVWIMVPAGDTTQQTVDKLAELLSPGDIIIDGGNSKWTDDKVRQEQLRPHGIRYIDVGTSGGVWGLEVGYCMMIGGDSEAVYDIEEILDVLAPLDDPQHGPGWLHVGSVGAGHFVKMVHNAIEYGMMQAFAEGYALFEASEYPIDNAAVSHLWMQGSVIRSWLCELAARAFEAEGNELSEIAPFVDDSGEGRWTVEHSIELRVPMPVATAALQARFASRGQDDFAAQVNAALRNEFGGHPVTRRNEG